MFKKTPLLLLHGALGAKEQFDALLPTLPSDYEPITINFEGHGGIAINRPLTINNLSDQLYAFLKRKDLKNVNVFGHSMGGYVALKTAIRHPELFQKIICLGTKFNWTPLTLQAEIQKLNPEKIVQKIPQFAKILEARHYPEDWKKLLHETINLMQGLVNGDAIDEKSFKAIKNKVVVGIGTKDIMVTKEESEWAVQSMQHATLKILENWAHPLDQIPVDDLSQFIRFTLLDCKL